MGESVSLLAGASLIVDYILMVAESISAGMEALVAAVPLLSTYTVELCLTILFVVTALNLRSLGDSARAFFLPTAVFIIGTLFVVVLVVVVIGRIHPLDPHARLQGISLIATKPLESISILLILKAFSSGCSALTGVDAIANRVPNFREPRVRHAKRTELLLGVILGVMLLGLALLTEKFHVGPSCNNTVLNQIMVVALGHGVLYYIIAFAVVIELALAANTSFGGLPLLATLLASDDYLPHFFALRSDRQVLARGVLVLSLLSAILLVGVGGNTNTPIPMFAIGVFTGFTLAQAGIAKHWLASKPPRWRRRVALNGLGATMTLVATVIFTATKFFQGAWIVVVVVPLLIFMFIRIKSYCLSVRQELAIGVIPGDIQRGQILVVVPITDLSSHGQGGGDR